MHQGIQQNAPSNRIAAANVFRLEGEYWTVAYGGVTIRLRDVSGLRYIAVLLQHPGEKIPAVALIDAQSDRANAKTVGDTRARRTHDAELARVRTTRSIKAALRRIGAHCAPLIAHLTATIRTGTDCSYLPDPRLPVQWEFGSDGDAHVNDADHSSTRTTIRNGA